MKSFCTMLLFLLCLLLISGCSDDSGSSNLLEIDLTNDDFQYDYDYWVLSGDYPISIYSRNEVTSFELIVNNIEFETDWEYVPGAFVGFNWATYIDFDELNGLEFQPGKELDYELMINGKDFHKKLTYPYQAIISYPQFSYEQDFSFSWTLEENPDYQIIGLIYGDNRAENEIHWQLNGSQRDHIISKEYFSELEEEYMTYFYIGYTNFNCKESGECLFTFINDGNYYDIVRGNHINGYNVDKQLLYREICDILQKSK